MHHFQRGCHRHGATKAKSLSTDPKGLGKNLAKCIKAKNHKELGRAACRVSKKILQCSQDKQLEEENLHICGS